MNATGIVRLFSVTLAMVVLQGCGGGSDPSEDSYKYGLGDKGANAVCSYDGTVLDAEGYASARVSYPCGLSGPAPATTLTGGFTNVKEQMYWLADHLSSHGYIVITATPTNILGQPSTWKAAHLSALKTLRNENTRAGSALYNRVDLDRLAIAGYSMGGGGGLLALGELGDAVHTAVLMAPYDGYASVNYANISARTLVLVGANDVVAPANSSESYFQSLPSTVSRMLAVYTDGGHLHWVGSSNPDSSSNDTATKTRFKVMVTAWLERHLKGSAAAETYLSGAEHRKHLADDWFTTFDDRRD